GRGAAVGDAMARILKAAGYDVTKEFYINDIGVQTVILGESVKLRFEELIGKVVSFPDNYYKGEYIKELAEEFRDEYGTDENNFTPSAFQDFAGEKMLEGIEKDLKDFGVEFDNWYSEGALVKREGLKNILTAIKNTGFTFEEDGATWMKTKELANDDKDRVLQKANGETTYFLSDVAYHKDKVKRGFDKLINIWGADHHGYEARVRAALKAFNYDDSILKIIFIQLVALLRDGAAVPMGKREGEFVTLRQVMDEVGADACRFFFLMRRSDAHLDFDLELAKKQAPENPVYYVHYCHARIQSIIAFAAEKGIGIENSFVPAALERLVLKEELDIIRHLSLFDETVEKSAAFLEPHRVTFYLTDLAAMFHPYYNKNRVVTE
ncbi:MAG: arginine--tRNA ligase, partial [Deltaproteobacteria bacterium]